MVLDTNNDVTYDIRKVFQYTTIVTMAVNFKSLCEKNYGDTKYLFS